MAPKDYKHRRKSTRKPQSGRGWLWFLVGLAVGVAGTLTAEVMDYFSAEQVARVVRQATGGDEGKLRTGDERRAPETKKQRPRFEFYTMLPEMEVAVPDHELTSERPPAETEREDVTYVLQAGSFKQLAQADRLKAELALIGMPAQIQTVSIEGGTKWHRVRVGPFTNLQALNEARDELQNNGLKVMVLKVRS